VVFASERRSPAARLLRSARCPLAGIRTSHSTISTSCASAQTARRASSSTERDRRIAQEMAALVERERRPGGDAPDGSEDVTEAG
jgi:hypothetical protein